MNKTVKSASLPQGSAPASEPVLNRTLTYRLHLLHKLTDYASQHGYIEATGLTLSDGRCLTTVGTFEPLSVNDLARASNLNKAQASRGAQSLVEKGLVFKKESPEDGRGVVLTLTAKGRRAWKKTMAMVQRRNEEIFSCLSVQDQVRLSRMFDQLIAHVSDHGAGRPEDKGLKK